MDNVHNDAYVRLIFISSKIEPIAGYVAATS